MLTRTKLVLPRTTNPNLYFRIPGTYHSLVLTFSLPPSRHNPYFIPKVSCEAFAYLELTISHIKLVPPFTRAIRHKVIIT